MLAIKYNLKVHFVQCVCFSLFVIDLITIQLCIMYRQCIYEINDIFTELAKVQDNEVGDGTTSVTVLAAELLRVN